jgi:hypothetical protein
MPEDPLIRNFGPGGGSAVVEIDPGGFSVEGSAILSSCISSIRLFMTPIRFDQNGIYFT